MTAPCISSPLIALFKHSPLTDSSSLHLSPPLSQNVNEHRHECRGRKFNIKNQYPKTNHHHQPINLPLILLNCTLMTAGILGGPLLLRLYYIHGGKRRWLISCIQNAGFPILIIPLTYLYILHTKKNKSSNASFFMEPKLFISSAFIGVLFGLDNFMYALGLSYIPVSTSSLLFATQLAFLACFSRLIVRQKFTAFSINAVVLMTLGSILLGIRSEGDRPLGVTKAEYLLGFLLTLGSAALVGFILPLTELSYSKATRTFNYTTLMQFQFNAAIFSTIFNLIGMLINKDFQAIPGEANEYKLGSTMYYFVLVAGAVIWQLSFIGGLGVILYTSSLFSGVFMAVLLPFTEVAAVIVYHESFTGEKGMAMALCLWGFANYFYGEYRKMKDMDITEPMKQEQVIVTPHDDEQPCTM